MSSMSNYRLLKNLDTNEIHTCKQNQQHNFVIAMNKLLKENVHAMNN